MKKVLAVVVVLCVVCVAGAALAQPRRHDEARRMPPPPQEQHIGRPGEMPPAPFGHRQEGCRMPKRGHRALKFAPDMPEEIRALVVEAAKLKIDLEAALSEKPINKDKALEVFAKLQKAEDQVEAWRFTKKIERIEAFRAQRELPAPAPAPEEAQEAPEPAPAPAE